MGVPYTWLGESAWGAKELVFGRWAWSVWESFAPQPGTGLDSAAFSAVAARSASAQDRAALMVSPPPPVYAGWAADKELRSYDKTVSSYDNQHAARVRRYSS